MIKNQIQVSSSFKKQSTKAILSIVLFVISYVLLLGLAIALTALCAYWGIQMIIGRPSFITMVLGFGLVAFGLIILFFLVKFAFKSNKIDYTMLIQVRRKEQPALFALIDEIVVAVGTDFPKKVYLSPEVNASVFYDSNFWSMFFPVRKNLMIGMGLVNSITDRELKAILSHEFGHFSQKTMKVGSYVYNVNQIIYNMLYDNDAYEKLIGNFAASSGIFSVVTFAARGVLRVIQWLLQKLYALVNVSYMGLSREMEFHADEIAAQITGYHPLKESLLRMGLAEYAYNTVLGFYEGKIVENLQSTNVFEEQRYVMEYLAKDSKLPLVNNLPSVSFLELNKFNKSKLVIKDQWASHPGVDERIAHLKSVAEERKEGAATAAMTIFSDAKALCEKLTKILFTTVNYEGEIKRLSTQDFKEAITKEFIDNSFDSIYNSYYDQGNPISFDLEAAKIADQNAATLEELFSDTMTDLKYTEISLRSDMETLKLIADGVYVIKTFDYDGKKYQSKESKPLLKKLEVTIEEVTEELQRNDQKIFSFFYEKAKAKGVSSKLLTLYIDFFEFDAAWDANLKTFSDLSQAFEFTTRVTPFKRILEYLAAAEAQEAQLKKQIRYLLEHPVFKEEIASESKKAFEKYLAEKWIYFEGEAYNEENLNTLYTALNTYPNVMSKLYFNLKKSLLAFQVSLLE
ncbi:M48 family metalloprotease [Ascidiimonas sp. W6]|uniref:M48 family metalloprotease n=1 Tax=Ascidiimonas meishanensis TaxID=3128903 RepID=UPI0030EBB706